MRLVLVSKDAIEYDIEIKIIKGTNNFKIDINKSPKTFEETTISGTKNDEGIASKKPSSISNDIFFSITPDQPKIFLEYLKVLF